MCVHDRYIALLYAAVYSGVIVKYGKPYLLYRSDGYVARYAKVVLLRRHEWALLRLNVAGADRFYASIAVGFDSLQHEMLANDLLGVRQRRLSMSAAPSAFPGSGHYGPFRTTGWLM